MNNQVPEVFQGAAAMESLTQYLTILGDVDPGEPLHGEKPKQHSPATVKLPSVEELDHATRLVKQAVTSVQKGVTGGGAGSEAKVALTRERNAALGKLLDSAQIFREKMNAAGLSASDVGLDSKDATS